MLMTKYFSPSRQVVLQEMITYLAETTLPFGSRLAHQKYELICFYREGTINKNNLPVIKLGDTVVHWKSSVVSLAVTLQRMRRHLMLLNIIYAVLNL